jgi:triacylglycerol lipase
VTRWRWLLCAAALVVGAQSFAEPVGAATPYPVSYHFIGDAIRYGAQPSPPGANDGTCRPSAAHPRPVVLVHGTAGNASSNWASMSASLANAGYCVYALTYGVPTFEAALPVKFGGLNTMESSAEEIKVFVTRVLAATGAAKVDIVGHSQGTMVPNYYAKFLGGAPFIDRYVSLSPFWQGGGPAFLAQWQALGFAYGIDAAKFFPLCGACPEFVRGSVFMNTMRAGGAAVPGITYTNIVTRYDEVVFPYTVGIEPGMTNWVLQDFCALDFSDHVQIPASRTAIDLVLNALDPAHAHTPRCVLTLPVIG